MDGQKFSKLRVFFSWSGDRSRAVAQAFKDWLPSVLQNVQPYFTPDDIEKGSRWGSEIREELENTDFGVIFLTPENVNAPWILFEAGALSKLEKSRVAPLLLALEPAEVPGPLGQLQLTRFSREDCFKLLETINRHLTEMGLGLEPHVLQTAFNRAWSELEDRVTSALAEGPVQPVAKRTQREMLEEVLERVRAIQVRDTPVLLPAIAAQQAGVAYYVAKASDDLSATLGVTPRTRAFLRRAGITSVDQLSAMTSAQLKAAHPLGGPRQIDEIGWALGKLGLKLREEDA